MKRREHLGLDLTPIIDVVFIILIRMFQPNEFVEFPNRLHTFIPAYGKSKLKQSQESFTAFLNDVFDDNGKFIEKETKDQRRMDEDREDTGNLIQHLVSSIASS